MRLALRLYAVLFHSCLLKLQRRNLASSCSHPAIQPARQACSPAATKAGRQRTAETVNAAYLLGVLQGGQLRVCASIAHYRDRQTFQADRAGAQCGT